MGKMLLIILLFLIASGSLTFGFMQMQEVERLRVVTQENWTMAEIARQDAVRQQQLAEQQRKLAEFRLQQVQAELDRANALLAKCKD